MCVCVRECECVCVRERECECVCGWFMRTHVCIMACMGMT